jgi:hypothetical protein
MNRNEKPIAREWASLLIGRDAAGELTRYGTVRILAVVATLATIYVARRIRAASG